MESLYAAFAKDIEVIYREDHTPTFNGWSTVDSALMVSNDLYQSLSFTDRMAISAGIMNMLVPLAEEVPSATPEKTQGGFVPDNKSYIYTYDWDQINEDYACMVFDASTGNIIFDEWFKVLKQHDVMSSVEDVDGLMTFLVKHGEVLRGDRISFQFKGDTNKGDGGSLET